MLKKIIITMMAGMTIQGGTTNLNDNLKTNYEELFLITMRASRDVAHVTRDLGIVKLYTTYTRYEDGGTINDVSTRIYFDDSSEDSEAGWSDVYYIDVFDDERGFYITTLETYQHDYDMAQLIANKIEEGFRNQ